MTRTRAERIESLLSEDCRSSALPSPLFFVYVFPLNLKAHNVEQINAKAADVAGILRVEAEQEIIQRCARAGGLQAGDQISQLCLHNPDVCFHQLRMAMVVVVVVVVVMMMMMKSDGGTQGRHNGPCSFLFVVGVGARVRARVHCRLFHLLWLPFPFPPSSVAFSNLAEHVF